MYCVIFLRNFFCVISLVLHISMLFICLEYRANEMHYVLIKLNVVIGKITFYLCLLNNINVISLYK